MNVAQQEPAVASVDDPMERLLAFESTTLPVISLYLNTQADKHGQTNYDQFVRKELTSRARTWPASSPERQSFEKDVERIQKYLETELQPSANGVAIFACDGAGGFFEALQLNAPIDENRVYVYNQPHLYHLARLDDEYPRYAALITDANSARIYVFGLGQTMDSQEVNGKKVQRVKVGGWSQARYQRRVQNAHKDHAKEVIDTLDRLVREENIKHIVLAGDPQMEALIQEQLPKQLADKVADMLKMDVKAPEHEVFEKTLESMRELDAQTDSEKTERLFNEFRRRGLAVVGPDDTLVALANGQVDELLISTSLEQTHEAEEPVEAILAPEVPDSGGGTDSEEPRQVLIADLLVTKAKQTDARVSFIEDPDLSTQRGRLGGFLRWR